MDDEELLKALSFYGIPPGDTNSIVPLIVKEEEEIIPPSTADDLALPLGIRLWRLLRVGTSFQDVLWELEDNFSPNDIERMLNIFDLAATKIFLRPRLCTVRLPQMKLQHGQIDYYKNIDGTWMFFIKNAVIKHKQLVYHAPMLKVVAAERSALEHFI